MHHLSKGSQLDGEVKYSSLKPWKAPFCLGRHQMWTSDVTQCKALSYICIFRKHVYYTVFLEERIGRQIELPCWAFMSLSETVFPGWRDPSQRSRRWTVVSRAHLGSKLLSFLCSNSLEAVWHFLSGVSTPAAQRKVPTWHAEGSKFRFWCSSEGMATS